MGKFKSFVFSLAKSLGEPYYNKGFVNSSALNEYLTGHKLLKDKPNPFYFKVNQMLVVAASTPKLKKLVEEEKLDYKTAARISAIKEKAG
ncbi:hypothetical protein A2903_01480 [Candidatus Nomurabacteria bacterium RIFCSPLOWO2_01_FULL_33_17]|uniref:Uncharacterized protein n=1 Tax=Candidatus Nomurabacteria bacterium RIFCSPLOWO2_01_FULL_33_17 TaxID=1801764 RepID=A0A1F6WPU3_9BACT|nr:MAG: hypothetical protein A2903_01480 [Candidatus Nomurabacteria bacterium RIFCSPLOWO2_01_FULL_33_17]